MAQGLFTSSMSLGGVVAGVVVVLYLLRRVMLPKPLKGIPYNVDAAGKLFGDVPEMMGYVMRTKRIFVSFNQFPFIDKSSLWIYLQKFWIYMHGTSP
jgi:hypothetical protein